MGCTEVGPTGLVRMLDFSTLALAQVVQKLIGGTPRQAMQIT
jgi:hypothetical protein